MLEIDHGGAAGMLSLSGIDRANRRYRESWDCERLAGCLRFGPFSGLQFRGRTSVLHTRGGHMSRSRD